MWEAALIAIVVAAMATAYKMGGDAREGKVRDELRKQYAEDIQRLFKKFVDGQPGDHPLFGVLDESVPGEDKGTSAHRRGDLGEAEQGSGHG